MALCGLRDIVANCELRIEEFRDLRYSILDNDLPFIADYWLLDSLILISAYLTHSVYEADN